MPAPKSISTETERVIRVGKVEALVDFCFGRPADPQRAYLECREEERVDEQWYGLFEASYRAARYGYACEEATDDRLGMIELTVRVPAHGTIVVSRPSERGSVRSSAVLTTDPVLMSLLESQRKVMDALAATEDEDAAARERLRDLGLGLGQEIGRRTIKVAVERGV